MSFTGKRKGEEHSEPRNTRSTESVWGTISGTWKRVKMESRSGQCARVGSSSFIPRKWAAMRRFMEGG